MDQKRAKNRFKKRKTRQNIRPKMAKIFGQKRQKYLTQKMKKKIRLLATKVSPLKLWHVAFL